MSAAGEFEIFLVANPGLEGPLCAEARAKGFKAKSVPGGVTLRGGWPEVWRANLEIRGASRVLALINRRSYADLMHGTQIDIALSPAQAMLGELLAYVRQGDVQAVHSLRRGVAEALEIVARGDRKSSKVVGRKVSELSLPRDVHIGLIVRGLPDALVAVGVPRAALVDDILSHTQIDQVAFERNAFAVHDVELGLLERWGDLVLDDLDPSAISHHVIAILNRRDAADVKAHGRIEL